jgi:hypothetical protein
MASCPYLFFIDAENEGVASVIADDLANDMVNHDRFSYYDDDATEVYPLDDQKAKDYVSEVLSEQERDLLGYLQKIRDTITRCTDQQIIDQSKGADRDPFFRVGMYRGTEVRFYDSNGVGLRSRIEVLREAIRGEKANMKRYLVVVIMHQ